MRLSRVVRTSKYPIRSLFIQSMHLSPVPMTFLAEFPCSCTISLFVSLMSLVKTPPHFVSLFASSITKCDITRILLIHEILVVNFVKTLSFRNFILLHSMGWGRMKLLLLRVCTRLIGNASASPRVWVLLR